MSVYHSPAVNPALIAGAAAAVLLMAGCGRADEGRTVGQQADSALTTVVRQAESARSGLRQEVVEARQDASQTSAELRQRAATAADNVAGQVQDATITASVNAAFAKDADLSALRINVDTVGGRVLLQGVAPDAEARERATRLASNVQGVTRVDNRLDVRS